MIIYIVIYFVIGFILANIVYLIKGQSEDQETEFFMVTILWPIFFIVEGQIHIIGLWFRLLNYLREKLQ